MIPEYVGYATKPIGRRGPAGGGVNNLPMADLVCQIGL